MIGPDAAAAFFLLALLLSATPGPDNLFVLVQSAAHGRRAGFSVVLGLCTGLLAHTLAVALGLAAVFAASAGAFAVLKAVGCGYLLYLAWGAWRAPAGQPEPGAAPPAAPSGGGLSWRMYGRGVAMNVTNPKVAFFFLALLPQFVRPAGDGGGAAVPVALQIACLGALFIAATLLVFGAVVLLAGTIRARMLRSPRARRWLNRAAALVFAGLAMRLALAQRP